jgi:PEGA domain-containing protein
MKRPLVSLGLCALTLGSTPALAQTSAHAIKRQQPLTQSLSGSAREAFTAAQVLVNNGDFTGAMTKFGQAYDLSKDPRLLFNMAVCARNLHDYARMQGLLVRYQHDGAVGMSAEDNADVENALAAIRTLVGRVKVSVNEADASVVVDGQRVGTTPLAESIVLNLGKHTVSVSKDGFQSSEQTLDLGGGTETSLSVTLVVQRHAGHLIVASDPNATVVIDGQSAAKGGFDGPLPVGTHEVQVTESGKLAYKAQVDLRDGETRSLDVTLENESQGAPIWPWIVGGVAVAAGAAIGGYFLFQPQETTTSVPVFDKYAVFQLSSLRLSPWKH